MIENKVGIDIKDLPFDKLVDFMTANVHSRLLLEGGSGLKQAVEHAMETAIRWRVERNEKTFKSAS